MPWRGGEGRGGEGREKGGCGGVKSGEDVAIGRSSQLKILIGGLSEFSENSPLMKRVNTE